MSNHTSPIPALSRASLWQLLLFVACYCLFNYLYFQVPDLFYRDVIYHYGVVKECVELINAVMPQEGVFAVQNHLLSAKADLEIVRGCDSAGVLFLLVAAVLVCPVSAGRKLVGLVLGIAWIYVLNMVRVIGLYFLIQGERNWFEFGHLYFAPSFMIIGALLFFLGWGAWESQERNEQGKIINQE
jgi:exosortase family protein XrtM